MRMITNNKRLGSSATYVKYKRVKGACMLACACQKCNHIVLDAPDLCTYVCGFTLESKYNKRLYAFGSDNNLLNQLCYVISLHSHWYTRCLYENHVHKDKMMRNGNIKMLEDCFVLVMLLQIRVHFEMRIHDSLCASLCMLYGFYQNWAPETDVRNPI